MINQFILSGGNKFFLDRWEYQFPIKCVNEEGYDKYSSCLFVGCYSEDDLNNILNHRGLVVIRWCGSDIKRISENWMNRINQKSNIYHIAISNWIADKLKEFGLKYKFIPLVPNYLDYWKCEGIETPKIYMYGFDERHGIDIVERVKKDISYTIIHINSCYKYNMKTLYSIYKECFLGLRLNSFDGESATVQEMGLMGRRTIYNGEQPAAIHWEDEQDVIELVNEESKKIGTIQKELSIATKNYFNVGNEWTKESFWDS